MLRLLCFVVSALVCLSVPLHHTIPHTHNLSQPTNLPLPIRYNFNDSSVSPIDAAAVQRAWGGKWSASSSFYSASYSYSGALCHRVGYDMMCVYI